MNWKFFFENELAVILSEKNGKKHLSISHKNRMPLLNEIKEMRYKHMPEIEYAAIIIPTKNDYINVEENCIHVFEL